MPANIYKRSHVPTYVRLNSFYKLLLKNLRKIEVILCKHALHLV